MKRNQYVVICLTCFFLINAHWAYSQVFVTEKSSEQSTPSTMKKKGILLFFMNPSGGACQMQARILEESKTEIETYYHLKYVVSTNQEDRSLFYTFGIRGIPAIVLLRSDGRIQQRLPPGVIPREPLLRMIEKVK